MYALPSAAASSEVWAVYALPSAATSAARSAAAWASTAVIAAVMAAESASSYVLPAAVTLVEASADRPATGTLTSRATARILRWHDEALRRQRAHNCKKRPARAR